MFAKSRWESWLPRMLAVLMTAGLAALSACTDEANPGPPLPTPDTVNDVVETTGWFPSILPDSTAFAQSRFDSTSSDDDGLLCADYIGDQRREVDYLTILDADADVHYAGSVLQYAGLVEPIPPIVSALRAGATLTLTGADGATVTGQVSATTGTEVAAWRLEALNELNSSTGGDWELSVGMVMDTDHLALAAGVDARVMPAEAIARLVLEPAPTARVLVRLQRTHHTVSCPYPARAGNAFADGVLGDDVADQMAVGNPPVWVEEVAHGELLLILVQAMTSRQELVDAAINTFAAAALGTTPDPGRPLLHDQTGLTARAFAPGADADAVATAAQASFADLAAMLAAPVADPSSLPPINAKLLALRNGGPLTLAIDGSYAFVVCEPFTPVFDDILWSLDVANAQTERRRGDFLSNGMGEHEYRGGSEYYVHDHVLRIPDLRGGGGMARPDAEGRLPIYWHDLLAGRPAMELYELPLPDGGIFSQIKFDGSSLVGAEYTLFIVASIPSLVRIRVYTDDGPQDSGRGNAVQLFLHGRENGNFRNLRLGFTDDFEPRLVWEHGAAGLDTHFDRPHDWHVYAFRFSLDDGMAAWLDGELIHSLSDRTTPLIEFNDATFCARWRGGSLPGRFGVLLLAEAIAYRGAGSDDDVAAEVARLREKYGL